ncbi:MAG TPA: hypothetical protein VD836_00605 [Solirubrobacteraceae bacterium]|nr:hypothetical protein [Solirubrobacteraceae bacterium]
MLELLRERPNWLGALSVALTRPPGVPERRAGEDPWKAEASSRPRRITDDLAWLRLAFEDPAAHGLRPIPRRKAIAAWDPDPTAHEKLARLRERHVLEAAGFELTDVPAPERVAPPRFERQPAAKPTAPTRGR